MSRSLLFLLLASACVGATPIHQTMSRGFSGNQIAISEILYFENTAGNTSSYDMGSLAITANRLYLAFTHWTDAASITSTNFITGSQTGVTWTFVTNITCNSIAAPANKLSVYRCMSASTSTSNATNEFRTTGTLDSNTGIECCILEIRNVDTSGTQGSGAIIQVTAGAADASVNPTLTFGSALDAGGKSAAIFAIGAPSNPPAGSANAGWTGTVEVRDDGVNTPAQGIDVHYALNTTDTTPIVTRDATDDDWAGIILEIKVLP